MGAIPTGFIPDKQVVPAGFVPDSTPTGFVPDTPPDELHPLQSFKSAISPEGAPFKQMLSSFDRGEEAWLEFSKRPAVRGMLAVIAPTEFVQGEAFRRAGGQEELNRRAAERDKTIPPAPEASIESILKRPGLASVGNWLGYQLGALPSQIGPGLLAGLAGGIAAGPMGAQAAAFPVSYVQNSGELYGNLIEKGLSKEDAALYATAGGIPMALLDTAVPGWLGGKLAKKLVMAKATEKIVEEVAQKSLIKKAVKTAGTAALGAVGEGGTETVQDIIATGVEHATTAKPGEPFLTPENIIRWADNFFAGLLMGGVVGGAVEALPETKQRGKSLEDFRRADASRQVAFEQEAAAAALAGAPAPVQEDFVEQQREADFFQTEQGERFWKEQEQRDLEATKRMLMEEEEIARAEEEAAGTLVREKEEPIEITAIPVEKQETPSLAAAPPLPSIHDLVSERNVEYHATDLEGFRGILETGRIAIPQELDPTFDPEIDKLPTTLGGPSHHEAVVGVSTSRIARIASKASKAITFVLDSTKMPARRPIAEEGYGKTKQTTVPLGFHEAPVGVNLPVVSVPNKTFEFENRTFGEAVPLSAVKAILVDRSALQQEKRLEDVKDEGWTVSSPDGSSVTFWDSAESIPGSGKENAVSYAHSTGGAVNGPQEGAYYYPKTGRMLDSLQQIQQLAASKNIPVRVYESGKEMHTTRARLLREKAEAMGLRGDQVLEQLKARIQAAKAEGRSFFRDNEGEIDHGVFADLVEYGAYRLAQGVTNFAAWSQEMVDAFGETVQPILRDIYDSARVRIENSDLPPPDPNTAAAIRALDGVMPSQEIANDLHADLDRFSWASRKFLDVTQWFYRNPHNRELGQYLEVLRKLVYFGDRWRSIANDTLQAGKKLSRKQTTALSNMIFDMVEWSSKITRRISEEERTAKQLEVAKRHGVDARGMEMYQRIHLDLLQALHEEEVAEAERIERTFARAAQTPENLVAKNQALQESAEKFADHRNKEYFPTTRFGRLAVIVKAKGKQVVERRTYGDNELVDFRLYEHNNSLGMPAHWRPNLQDGLKEAKTQYPSDRFHVYEWELPEEAAAGLQYPSALYKAIETGLNLTEEQRADLRQLIIKSSPAQAFIQHWGRKRNVKGFSRDIWRAYASYFQGFANHIARLKYRDELNDTLLAHQRTVSQAGKQTGSARTRQQIQNALQAHFNDFMHPRNYAPNLRALAFQLYFFMVPKQAIINLTQLPVFLYPYLTAQLRQDGVPLGVADAMAVAAITKATAKAAKMYQGKIAGLGGAAIGGLAGLAGGPAGVGLGANIGGALGTRLAKAGTFALPQDETSDARLLKWGHETALLDQGYATTMGSIAGGSAIVPLAPVADFVRDVGDSGTQLFRASEQFMRIVTMLAANDLGQRRGMTEGSIRDFAQDAIWRTMFIHESWARPELLRGKASMATIFATFLQKATFAFFQNPGKMRSWLMMGILGGLMGLPFGEDLLKLLDASGFFIKKAFFKDKDPRVDTELMIRETLAEMGANPDLLLHGLSSTSFGFPYLGEMVGADIPSMDFSSSLSMGRVARGLDPALKASMGMLSGPDFLLRVAQDAMGVVGTMGNGLVRTAFEKDDKALVFARLLMPQFAKHAMMAFEAQHGGRITDTRGRELVKFDLNNQEHRNEILAMGLGARPARLARMTEAQYNLYERGLFYAAVRDSLVRDFVNAKVKGEDSEPALARLRRVNAVLPKDQKITAESILSSVRERLTDRKLAEMGLPDKVKEKDEWERFKRAHGVE